MLDVTPGDLQDGFQKVSNEIEIHEGRGLFGLDPAAYDVARPPYPDWIFERLRDEGVLASDKSVLEIGAGTGLATRQLISFGANDLTVVEPDSRFSSKLQDLSRESKANIRIVETTFEEARIEEKFDLIVAATSFHWLDQAPALIKARRLLKPAGAVGLFWHVFQIPGKPDAFHDATKAVLASLAISPSVGAGQWPFALDKEARLFEARSAGFERVDYAHSEWTLRLDPDQVVMLYGSFAHLQRLEPEVRRRILEALREIAIEQFDGAVERNMTACLYVYRNG